MLLHNWPPVHKLKPRRSMCTKPWSFGTLDHQPHLLPWSSLFWRKKSRPLVMHWVQEPGHCVMITYRYRISLFPSVIEQLKGAKHHKIRSALSMSSFSRRRWMEACFHNNIWALWLFRHDLWSGKWSFKVLQWEISIKFLGCIVDEWGVKMEKTGISATTTWRGKKRSYKISCALLIPVGIGSMTGPLPLRKSWWCFLSQDSMLPLVTHLPQHHRSSHLQM